MRRFLAAALVAVLALSAVALALPLSAAQPTGGHALAQEHPSAGITISSLTYYGGYTDSYWTGYYTGEVYFYATDVNGDHTGTVQINDKNATRDGITNPAATWTVTLTGGYNDSTFWGGHYLIPLTLRYGGQWNITFTTALGGFTYQNFTVHTYEVSVDTVQPAVLTAHTFGVAWFVSSPVNGSALPGLGLNSYTLLALYWTGTTYAKVSGTPMTLPSQVLGTVNLTAPAAAENYILLEVWANLTGTVTQSENGGATMPIATLNNPYLCLGASPVSLDCGGTPTFTTGEPIYASVYVGMTDFYDDTWAASGLNAAFVTENNGLVVTTPGSPPPSVLTNATGYAVIVFLGDVPPFSTSNNNQVVVTITDPLNPAISLKATMNFDLSNATGVVPRLELTLNSVQFYGGDTVTATWTIWGQNSTVTKGWSADSWFASSVDGAFLYGAGLITSTGLTGTFSFTLPISSDGEFYVVFHAHNATLGLENEYPSGYAWVTPPTILLTPSEATYLPGDSVTVAVATEGSALGNATFYQSVTDSTGATLSSGVLSNHAISFTVPAVGAPNSITVSVAAQTSGGVIAQTAITIYEASGYTLTLGVQTASNYLDGSFQPGQTITLGYTIGAVGTTIPSKSFTLWVYPEGAGFGNREWVLQTTSLTGTISVTIPSGAPNGILFFYGEVEASVCSQSCYAETSVALSVNPNPAVPNYQVIPNTGITVAWLILLILIIVVALLLYMMIRRRNRPMVMKADSSSGGTPPAQNWKETTPSSSSPPSGAGGGSGGSSSAPPPLPGDAPK